jgi:hypothetical protein
MIKVLSSSPSIAGPARSAGKDAISRESYTAQAGGTVRSRTNWRRGCFRLWVVGSALYVIALAAIPPSEIRAEFENLYRFDWLGLKPRLVPSFCSEARGVMGKDFALKMETPGTCWYELPNFRPLYPEYKTLSDSEVSARLHTSVGRPLPPIHPTFPWPTLFKWIAMAVSIPLLVLTVGAAIGWALCGFTPATSRNPYDGA